jgi:predicted MFS family arabinose efflux permease
VSVPLAALAAIGVTIAVTHDSRQADTRVDVAGAVLATAGLSASVFGFSQAETEGWAASATLGGLAAGLILLTLFVWWQSRTAHALLPLRIVLDRRRGGAYLATFSMAVGNFAAFFFLTFYLQTVLGYPPVEAGLAFLPYTAAIVLGVRIARRFIATAPVRLLLATGLLSTAAGLALLGQLHTDSGYVTHLLPVVVLLGLGNAWVLVPANSTATQGAGPDAGVAGATVMTSMQIGSSVGIALLAGIAATAADAYQRAHAATADLAKEASVHGYAVASLAAAASLCAAAATVYLAIGPDKRRA